MSKINKINSKHVFLILLLAFALLLSYLAGTISVEAQIALNETRMNSNQIAAVSSAISLLLLGNDHGETLFFPLIMK
jgi:hypothetical protein